jgi:hypothetical protein
MDNIPFVWLIERGYENVVAICPFCQKKIVFNRRSDLDALSPITYKTVQCLNPECKKVFLIKGDIINQAYEILIFDCEKLKGEKRYSACILNLAQSLEMFFTLYLRVYLLYKPFANERTSDRTYLNKVDAMLTKKIKGFAFSGMRALFLNHIILTKVLMKRNAISLKESEAILHQLHTNNPSRDLLLQVPDPNLAEQLIRVVDTKIDTMRNNVVHKSGYRPSLKEADAALLEARQLVYGLLPFLSPLVDSVNAYFLDIPS